jgi:uncharacterized protein YbaP (TraB family)
MHARLARRFAGAAVALGSLLAFVQATRAQEATAPAKTEKAFLWKVTSDAGEAYLLGSLHLAPPELYPLPKEIEDAFKKSDTLVVEADADAALADPQGTQKLIADLGQYPKGDSLSKHVSKETFDALKDYCNKQGFDVSNLEANKPWLVSLSLQQIAMTKLGLDPQKGIDLHFLRKAKRKDKEKKVLELESVKGQLELMGGMDDSLQEKMLASTLKESEKLKEMMDSMLDAWKNGDAAAMEKIITQGLVEQPDLKPYYVKMFDERNAKMAEKIEGYLKEKGPFFVVVGAGHLVGEKGLVALLRSKQFKVEQVTKAAPAPKTPEPKTPEKEKVPAGEDSGKK